MATVDWEATDQFGNLYVGHSYAQVLSDLGPELEDMIDKLRDRSNGPIVLTIDMDYGQINGPLPDQVSHVLNVPLLATLADSTGDIVAAIRDLVGQEALVSLAE
jgi:hypothetical protein